MKGRTKRLQFKSQADISTHSEGWGAGRNARSEQSKANATIRERELSGWS